MKKRIGIIVIIVVVAVSLLVLLQKPIAIMCFMHAGTWKQSAEFEDYKEEFVLVRDCVESYMNGNSGTFLVSYSEEHKFDLYHLEEKQYIDCPEEIKKAIEILCKEAFRDKDTSFDYLTIDADEIAFRTEKGPYKLSYSPHKKPIMEGYTADETLIRRLGDGWYHVTRRP